MGLSLETIVALAVILLLVAILRDPRRGGQ
jgi:hypothetical protein